MSTVVNRPCEEDFETIHEGDAFHDELSRDTYPGLLVAGKRCARCLFSKNPLVSPERRREILAQCREEDCHFVCHEYTHAEDGNSDVCCNGFYEANPQASTFMQVSQRLGYVRLVHLYRDTVIERCTTVRAADCSAAEGANRVHACQEGIPLCGTTHWSGSWYILDPVMPYYPIGAQIDCKRCLKILQKEGLMDNE